MKYLRFHTELPDSPPFPSGSLDDVWDTPKRWRYIREYYAAVTPWIMAGHRPDPYGLIWPRHMTPIELRLWEEIRWHGLPFYPQYPVGRRFVDFGDPLFRIGLEADGAAFHSPDKDAQKNAEISEEGWSLFRFTGKQIYGDSPLKKLMVYYGRDREGIPFPGDEGDE